MQLIFTVGKEHIIMYLDFVGVFNVNTHTTVIYRIPLNQDVSVVVVTINTLNSFVSYHNTIRRTQSI